VSLQPAPADSLDWARPFGTERVLAIGSRAITAGLFLASVLAVWLVVRTGAPLPFVLVGLGAVGFYATLSWWSGGRFEFEGRESRPLGPHDPPVIRRAIYDVCERTDQRPPAVVVAKLDAPGAVVGYDHGRRVIVVDPLLVPVVGPDGLRAILAHEIAHLRIDIHTDAVRAYLPRLLGFASLWTVLLAGRGPGPATVGAAVFVALALTNARWPSRLRYALGLGVEPLALATSRYANRLEEFRADAAAARVVPAAAVTDALFRVAAVATGDNDEDVAGPVPWEADRSLHFRLFATHPSIEARAAALGCELPAWVRPSCPHATRPPSDPPAGRR
jgi:Zn-dependent protease with chaperone function